MEGGGSSSGTAEEVERKMDGARRVLVVHTNNSI